MLTIHWTNAVVTGVTWRPFYDLHATTIDGQPSPDVSMRYCVAITQHTGEDWNDAALTLSTASSQALRQLTVPVLSPLKISVERAVSRKSSRRMAETDIPTQSREEASSDDEGGTIWARAPIRSRAAAPMILAQNFRSNDGAPAYATIFRPLTIGPVKPRPPSVVYVETQERAALDRATPRSFSPDAVVPPRSFSPLAVVPPRPYEAPSLANRDALSVVYHVQDTVTLPSDGEEHRLIIATLDFKAKLKYMCVPRQAPTVYIVAKVKNTSEFDLLSGPVNVFMNDSYVTKTAIPVRISFSQPLGQRSIRCI